MGFLSRIVADARAHAPMVRATARDVDRTQAAAEGGEIVEAGPPLSPPSPSPSGVELAATLSATPPMAVAPRSATHSAPAHDDRNAAPDPAARAPGDRPGLPVVPSSSPASPAAARAAMTASGAPSTPQPLASRRAPVSAEPARSRIDEAAAHQVRAAVPDSRRAGAPEHTHARVDQRPAARATDDRGGPAREAPIAQIDTAAPPGGRTEPAAPQATRAAAPTPTPTLLEAIPPAEPQATPAARSDSLVPAPRVEISPSARATEPRRPERPSPMTEPVAARGVHIGRIEVIVVAPSQPPARPAQRGPADLASRRYLRNA
jgi:hypothetical protein